MTALQSLNLRGCEKITHAGLKELGNLSALAVLNLSRCEGITEFKELSRMTSLAELNLAYCERITDVGIKKLGQMTGLTSLDLRCCYNTYAEIDELTEQLPRTSILYRGYYSVIHRGR